MTREILFHARQVDGVIEAMAGEIRRALGDVSSLIVVGIQSGGLNVAKRIQQALQRAGMGFMVLGTVDTTLYRDDIHQLLPEKGLLPMEIPANVENADILLVDDVIFTGRSARAAMDALFYLGRPRMIRLAVLVDRGHRELPIQPDFTGLRIQTQYEDEVDVSWDGLRGWVEIVRGERSENRRKGKWKDS